MLFFFLVARGEVRQRNRVVVARERRAWGEGRGFDIVSRTPIPRLRSSVTKETRARGAAGRALALTCESFASICDAVFCGFWKAVVAWWSAHTVLPRPTKA